MSETGANDLISDEEFRERVKKAIEHLSKDEMVKIADELTVAPSTIRRWANGVASPFPTLRPIILKAMEKTE